MVAEEEDQGVERVRRSMGCCKLQDELGGYYLHEHPKDAWSWDLPEVKEMENRPNAFKVQSPMCRFDMQMLDKDGQPGYVRKG